MRKIGLDSQQLPLDQDVQFLICLIELVIQDVAQDVAVYGYDPVTRSQSQALGSAAWSNSRNDAGMLSCHALS